MDRSFRKEKDGVHIIGFQSNYSNLGKRGHGNLVFSMHFGREEVILITQKGVDAVSFFLTCSDALDTILDI